MAQTGLNPHKAAGMISDHGQETVNDNNDMEEDTEATIAANVGRAAHAPKHMMAPKPAASKPVPLAIAKNRT